MNNEKLFTKPKLFISLFLITCSCLLSALFFSGSALAVDSSSEVTETIFFDNIVDDGKGCGVYTILNLVVDILSIGVGILGVIGIMVVGIQYLTAGGNEQQTTKAKRRVVEIVIGLVAFAVLYAFLQWLLPGGKLNNNTKCETISDEELASLKEQEKNKGQNNQQGSSGNSNSSKKNNAPFLKESQFNRECLTSDKFTTTGEKIVCILDKISIWADKNNIHYGNNSWKGADPSRTMNCATFTTAAYIEAGILKKGDYFALQGDSVQNWDAVAKRGTLVKTNVPNDATIKTLAKQGTLKPGDTIGLATHHTYMYIGKNSKGKYMCQQLGRGQTIFNNGSHQHSKSKFECGSRKVYTIIHPKRSIEISL